MREGEREKNSHRSCSVQRFWQVDDDDDNLVRIFWSKFDAQGIIDRGRDDLDISTRSPY